MCKRVSNIHTHPQRVFALPRCSCFCECICWEFFLQNTREHLFFSLPRERERVLPASRTLADIEASACWNIARGVGARIKGAATLLLEGAPNYDVTRDRTRRARDQVSRIQNGLLITKLGLSLSPHRGGQLFPLHLSHPHHSALAAHPLSHSTILHHPWCVCLCFLRAPFIIHISRPFNIKKSLLSKVEEKKM